jgi:hypothetical protein
MTERPKKFCSSCGAEIDAKAKICPKCGVEQPSAIGEVSNWWYLVPFFFSFIGGIIAWAVNKDSDPKKAKNMLIFGIVWTFVPVIIVFVFWAALLAAFAGGGFYP